MLAELFANSVCTQDKDSESPFSSLGAEMRNCFTIKHCLGVGKIRTDLEVYK